MFLKCFSTFSEPHGLENSAVQLRSISPPTHTHRRDLSCALSSEGYSLLHRDTLCPLLIVCRKCQCFSWTKVLHLLEEEVLFEGPHQVSQFSLYYHLKAQIFILVFPLLFSVYWRLTSEHQELGLHLCNQTQLQIASVSVSFEGKEPLGAWFEVADLFFFFGRLLSQIAFSAQFC